MTGKFYDAQKEAEIALQESEAVRVDQNEKFLRIKYGQRLTFHTARTAYLCNYCERKTRETTRCIPSNGEAPAGGQYKRREVNFSAKMGGKYESRPKVCRCLDRGYDLVTNESVRGCRGKSYFHIVCQSAVTFGQLWAKVSRNT